MTSNLSKGRSIKKHAATKQASKRQFLGNTAVKIGQAYVQDSKSPVPQAALAQAKGNPGDKSTEFQTNQGYRSSGCYKDTESRAIPSLEGSDPELTGFYKQRQEPISKCATVARSRGYQLFAIQNEGMCLSGPKAHETYKIHGLARNCKDGKGGEWANDVYIFNDFPLQLHIFTGTEPEAGTDANVYITLSGSMGTSRRISLAPENANQNPFEAGQKDVFKIHTIPLGAISGITIGHDNAGEKAADWFLHKVVVQDAAKTMYKFEVNRWLANDKDDGKIERELSLTATINPGSYKPLGCFKERTDVNKDRAIPSLEGRDDVLDGVGLTSYRGREFPIEKCADAARRRGYVMFAIQDGGLCATSKEIQNTYDTYGDGNDCMVNGTGSAFSSTVYTFSDEEPGFQDAELSAGGENQGSENAQNQPAEPSDPAMQVAGQLSSQTQTQRTPGKTDTSFNKQEQTPATGTTSSGGKTYTESAGNEGNQPGGNVPNPQATANRESHGKSGPTSSTGDSKSGSSVGGISGGQEGTKIDNEGVKGGQTSEGQEGARTAESNKGDLSSGGQEGTKIDNEGVKGGQEGTRTNNESVKGDQTGVEHVQTNEGTSKEEKEPATSPKGPNPEENQVNTNVNEEGQSSKLNGNSRGQQTIQRRPHQNIEKTTNSPVKTDATPQEPKIRPGREDKIPKPGDQSRLEEGSPVVEAPLVPKVHKIAPETRLPGEFTSPPSDGHNIILKTKLTTPRRPFSRLLDAYQRDKIRLAHPKK